MNKGEKMSKLTKLLFDAHIVNKLKGCEVRLK